MFSTFLRLTVTRRLSKSIAPCNASWTVSTLANLGNLCRQSTFQSTTGNAQQVSTNSLLPDHEVNEFLSVFPEVLESLVDGDRVSPKKDCPEFAERMAEMMSYTVPTGGRERAHMLLATYRAFEKPENLTDENLKLARILGWITEMTHAAFVIGDDFDEGAEKRRGNKTWYHKSGMNREVINDAFIVGFSIQILMKKYFYNHPCYLRFHSYFVEMMSKSVFGQSSETFYARNLKKDLGVMTVPLFKWIAENKLAYTAHLPVIPAMFLANVNDEKLLRPVKKFCEELTIYFQMQNDYADIAGKGIHKRPEDVRLGSCSWVAAKALELVNPNQRKIMEEHFGRNNKESEKIIHDLYKELDLPNVYRTCEKEITDELRQQIEHFPEGLPRQHFSSLYEYIIAKPFS